MKNKILSVVGAIFVTTSMAQAATTTYVAEDILPAGLATLQAERANWAADFGNPLGTEGFEGLVGNPGNFIDFGAFSLSFSGPSLTLYGANPLTRTEGTQGLGFSGNGSITLTFDNAISALGIDWSSFDQNATVVSYSDDNGNVVGDIFQPVISAGAGFFGIIDTDGFTSVTFAVDQSEILEFDYIQWGSGLAPIPLPAGMPLLLGGLVGLGLLRRRKKT